MSNEILTRIFLTKEGILYPIKGIFDNIGYIAKMTYFEPLKYKGKKPEFLNRGENKLNTAVWNKLISEREEYIDKEKGNLRINIELPAIVETLLEEKESITLQTDGTDIILIKELKGLNKELYNIIAIDDLDYKETNLHYKDCGTNFVSQMPYKKEINYLL
ncbi:MAG: hypothetical protein KAI51_03870 [Candidatus Aenigmarchaeota archaeon]|nr:hypothetical protein [Candidatus Aenigmarchaeota archaeon]